MRTDADVKKQKLQQRRREARIQTKRETRKKNARFRNPLASPFKGRGAPRKCCR